MDNARTILEAIGLSKTETNIYIAGLSSSSISPSDLAKQTGIKRPTVYHALSTLMDKGLAAKRDVGNKTIFSMTNPSLLPKVVEQKITFLQQKRLALEDVMPALSQLKPVKKPKVLVSHYEGVEGIKLLMEEAYYCQSRHWEALAPRNNFFLQFDKDYTRYFLETRKQRGITARTLWERGIDEVRGRKLSPTEIAERNPRYLPKNMWGKFNSTMFLFDGKVAFISSIKELIGVLIQSDDIYSTMQAVFDGLWEVSTAY